MNDRQMWAIYDSNDNMVFIESKDGKSGKVRKTIGMCTPTVSEIGDLMDKVLEIEPQGKFYIVRGTFIPEEKL